MLGILSLIYEVDPVAANSSELETVGSVEAYITSAISIVLIVSLALIADRLVQVRTTHYEKTTPFCLFCCCVVGKDRVK